METTLNQEAICTLLAERLKQLTESIEKAKSEDELAEIAENIAAAGKAANDSIERAYEDGSLSGYKAAMSLRALGDALEGTALLLLLRGMQLKREEEEADDWQRAERKRSPRDKVPTGDGTPRGISLGF